MDIRSVAAARAPEPRRIAFITADNSVAPKVEQFLEPSFQVRLLDSWSQLAPLLTELPLDAVLLDLDTQGIAPAAAIDLLAKLRGMNQDLTLMALTRSPDHDLRLKAAKDPVDDFFVSPVDFRELQIILDRNLEKRAMEIENRRVTEQIAGRYSFYELIGGSEPMRRVYDAILRVAHSDVTVMIRGESGTGKELVARSIVAVGPRRERPFISLNCAALPEALIESELFGHEKGAFTGAHASRPGQIEMADTGTLFLDEIATLSPELQTKLLRVLESHTVQRLGGRTTKHVDFRLLTATNENLEEMVRVGRFREDLSRDRTADVERLLFFAQHVVALTELTLLLVGSPIIRVPQLSIRCPRHGHSVLRLRRAHLRVQVQIPQARDAMSCLHHVAFISGHLDHAPRRHRPNHRPLHRFQDEALLDFFTAQRRE
jgi:DNA-binding NtrC family response regulator